MYAADFEEIVAGYGPELFGYARRMLANWEDAEEVVQDALVRAHRALSKMPAKQRIELRLKPWLYTITRNLAANRLRKKRRITISLDALPDPERVLPAASDAGPEAIAEANAAAEVVEAALQCVPAPLRAAARMRFIEGRTNADIARISGQPLNVVKAHVSRATRLMRRMWPQHEAPASFSHRGLSAGVGAYR